MRWEPKHIRVDYISNRIRAALVGYDSMPHYIVLYSSSGPWRIQENFIAYYSGIWLNITKIYANEKKNVEIWRQTILFYIKKLQYILRDGRSCSLKEACWYALLTFEAKRTRSSFQRSLIPFSVSLVQQMLISFEIIRNNTYLSNCC